MVKLFKNKMLSIFLTAAFSFLQIVNVNANHLKNSFQQEYYSASVVKKEENTVISTASLSIPSLKSEVRQEAITEGKIEKVAGPLTLGVGVMVAGYAMSAISTIIGWITQIIAFFR
ncbi:Uncharacterised protein [Candidatus Bartonella washoeensis]|uniref:Protein-disulfide reductase n=1 Tax=Candidatus Bartonella washoeensis Sb944nv TaxID=1094563 RepID=J1JBZ8_9HYPH|nr:hypothetical protein [Bartonella washoeensis]EJF81530.1 hypothetical protein MCQ_00228 [Bartonella washoeensis Sb944nv]SPU26240.1 Uncharacterised protein [Bartonella washoeensis]